MMILVRAKRDVELRGEFAAIEVLLSSNETLPRDLLPVFANMGESLEGHIGTSGVMLKSDIKYPRDAAGARAFIVKKPIPMWMLNQLEEADGIEINREHLLEKLEVEVDLKDRNTTETDTTFCEMFK